MRTFPRYVGANRFLAPFLSCCLLLVIGLIITASTLPASASTSLTVLSTPTPANTQTSVTTYTTLPPCNAPWYIAQVPAPGIAHQLHDVSAVDGDVWAVGNYDDGTRARTLTLHSDGNAWTQVQSPVTGTAGLDLYGVGTISANDVWAVGYYHIGGSPRTMAMHWDGSAWSFTATPELTGSPNNALIAVDGTASDDVWSVGSFNMGSERRTLIEHWDGASWSVVPSPNVGSIANALYDVKAFSSNDVWAVGEYYTVDQRATLIQHWDGSTWSVISSPSPGPTTNFLLGIDGISASDIWAVGLQNNGTSSQTLILHWDGAAWTTVPSPNVPGSTGHYLNGISTISGESAWAVGWHGDSGGNSTQTLALHWDGQQWSIFSAEGPAGALRSQLAAVASAPGLDAQAWSVGFSVDQSGIWNPLVLERTMCYLPTSTPTPSSTTTSTVPASMTPVATSTTNTPVLTGTSTATSTPCASCSSATATNTPVLTSISTSSATGTHTTVPTSTNTLEPTRTATTAQMSTRTSTSIPSPTATPCRINFTDLPWCNSFERWAICLACKGILSGYADGTFRPGNPVTRGQLAKIISNALQLTQEPVGQTFEDVQIGSTFYTFIERISSLGLVAGYPCGGVGEPCIGPQNRPYFRPGAGALRGQIAKIVSNAANFNEPPVGQFFEDVTPGSTFYTWVQRLASRAIMSGYPCGGVGEPCIGPHNRPYFRFANGATRAQTAKIVGGVLGECPAVPPVPTCTPTPSPTFTNTPTFTPTSTNTRAETNTPTYTHTRVPTATPTQPQGQRTGARCNDGTYSCATGSGACSHHGGVDYWIYYPQYPPYCP